MLDSLLGWSQMDWPNYEKFFTFFKLFSEMRKNYGEREKKFTIAPD